MITAMKLRDAHFTILFWLSEWEYNSISGRYDQIQLKVQMNNAWKLALICLTSIYAPIVWLVGWNFVWLSVEIISVKPVDRSVEMLSSESYVNPVTHIVSLIFEKTMESESEVKKRKRLRTPEGIDELNFPALMEHPQMVR